ncbi:MAG: serine O-acetyltransferase, partial [Rhizobiales bacterium]|nr:serine O-acetyltransferase [Hyphomicrobiales bacterium]
MSLHNPRTKHGLRRVDPIWEELRNEVQEMIQNEPELAGFAMESVLNHDNLEDAVIHRIVTRLDHGDISGELIRQAYEEAIADDPSIGEAFRADIAAIYDRDPACHRYLEPVFYFKGFHAVQTHRLAHWLWNKGRKDFAYNLQSRTSQIFQIDIHPAVRMGKGIMLDHGHAIVMGETAVIEDDVSILHGVTLGGTGKEGGERHPKIRACVLIGAGAIILGDIEVGTCSRVAAGSVVLKDVPPNTTVVGVPAKVVGRAD